MRTGTKTTRAARDVAVVGPRDDAARTLNRTYLSSKAARAGAGEEEAWTRCVVDRVEARSRSLVLRVIDGSDRVSPIFAATESDERALLRSGADPNFINSNGDATIFWAIDGGPELVKLLYDYGADLNVRTAKDATPLSYARAMGKYGLVDEKGIYPEDVLKFYGANEIGSEPPCHGTRSPRESFDISASNFSRDRGSYQNEPEHP